ncbi:MAG: flagellar motor switch phosphatase FliY [Sporolactobacillus sp.]
MSDGKLTQEEIDALLGNKEETKRGAESVAAPEAFAPAEPSSSPSNQGTLSEISAMEADVLGEIGNISFGSAATALSACLNQKVDITTPEVTIVHRKDLGDEFPVPYVSVRVTYTEGFTGSCMLVIKITDASIIANLMMGGDGRHVNAEISEMEMSAVQEAMNQMMGSSATAMSTVFSRRIDISPPNLTLMDVRSQKGTEFIPDDETMFEISFQLRVGDLIDSNIMLLIPLPFGKTLVNSLVEENGTGSSTPSPDASAAPGTEPAVSPGAEAAIAADDLLSLDKQQTPRREAAGESRSRDVHPLEFSDFDGEEQKSAIRAPRNLDLLMDIPLDVSVELGHTTKTVREVLELGPGSIIELDKLAGEAIDILVNKKYIAKGEVVVVDENFGIRITEILNPYDRLKNLK